MHALHLSCILTMDMAADLLTRIKQSPVLCDGAMGTLLYAKGVFINRCYDELNLSQPDLIRAIHHDYLQAGAEIIETNTFGANAFRLARHSIADKPPKASMCGLRDRLAPWARESSRWAKLLSKKRGRPFVTRSRHSPRLALIC
jgi:methionine synthase I (cobalamin-dependent)